MTYADQGTPAGLSFRSGPPRQSAGWLSSFWMALWLPLAFEVIAANAKNQLNAVTHAESSENSREVGSDGGPSQSQCHRDFLVLLALQDQPDDVGLARRQAQGRYHILPLVGTQR